MEPDRRIALLADAGGLVGGFLLRRPLAAPEYARVHALSRRPLPLDHPRPANRILPLEQLLERPEDFSCDDALCCLGTTLRPAGSLEVQRQVDVGLVPNFAGFAWAAGKARRGVFVHAGEGLRALARMAGAPVCPIGERVHTSRGGRADTVSARQVW